MEPNERRKKPGKNPQRVVHDQATTSSDRKHGRVLGLVPVRRRRNGMGRRANLRGRATRARRPGEIWRERCWWVGRRDKWKAGTRVKGWAVINQ